MLFVLLEEILKTEVNLINKRQEKTTDEKNYLINNNNILIYE
jgi:hypothetical protein